MFDCAVVFLEFGAGSAPVARANTVKALADDELPASEIESFVDEIKAVSLSDRQRRINDVVHPSNTIRAADAVTAEQSLLPANLGQRADVSRVYRGSEAGFRSMLAVGVPRMEQFLRESVRLEKPHPFKTCE